jgi:hypothetical protein
LTVGAPTGTADPDHDEAVLGNARSVECEHIVETETFADLAHAKIVAEG